MELVDGRSVIKGAYPVCDILVFYCFGTYEYFAFSCVCLSMFEFFNVSLGIFKIFDFVGFFYALKPAEHSMSAFMGAYFEEYLVLCCSTNTLVIN